MVDLSNIELISSYGIHFSAPIDKVAGDLAAFEQLLIKWQRVQNLVSRETMNEIWTRHFCDSLQLLRYLPTGDMKIVDIGSGGGFPSIPLAIAMRGKAVNFHLIEANSRKASFLRTVSRELDLGLVVHSGRAEEEAIVAVGPVEIVTSRATARLDHLLSLALPFFQQDTLALFHKGSEFGVELEESRANWLFDVVAYSSELNASGAILEISNLKSR